MTKAAAGRDDWDTPPADVMQENSSKVDQEFLVWISDLRGWYKKEADKWARRRDMARYTLLFIALTPPLVTFFVSPGVFSSWGQSIIIFVNMLAVALAEIIAQLQLSSMAQLRENGHIESHDLHRYVLDKFEEYCNNREKISEIKNEVRTKVKDLERAQHRGFVSINSEFGRPKQSAKPREESPSRPKLRHHT